MRRDRTVFSLINFSVVKSTNPMALLSVRNIDGVLEPQRSDEFNQKERSVCAWERGAQSIRSGIIQCLNTIFFA